MARTFFVLLAYTGFHRNFQRGGGSYAYVLEGLNSNALRKINVVFDPLIKVYG